MFADESLILQNEKEKKCIKKKIKKKIIINFNQLYY